MRRLLVLLAAIGCTKAGDEAPVADRAEACLAVAREVSAALPAMASNPLGPPPPAIEKLGCPQLYQRTSCAKAWDSVFRPDGEIERVLETCAGAYCSELPAGVRACGRARPVAHNDRVDMIIELDRAILILERFDPVTADKLSRRSILLREAVVEAPPRPDAGPPEPTLVLAVTADGRTMLGGAAVAAADLPGALRGAATTHRSLVIAADRSVPYKRVVEIMDQAKSAGFEKLAIQTEGAAP